ncbi:AI-2E family transporter [Phaeobacter sp. NW0010-22]|uniref:AI-2E family transporter n=1 Tax=Phaeobacter sp. NW0010-22 TaxID=3135907 RepID=UPI003103E796
MAVDANAPATEVKEPVLVVPRQIIALASLLALTLVISIVFLELIRPFLGALALAAIVSALVQPFYKSVLRRTGEREGLASTITVLVGILLVVGPLIGVGYLAADQASGLVVDADHVIAALSEDVVALKGGTFEFPSWVPFAQELAHAGPQIFQKAEELLGSAAAFLTSELSHLTNGTAKFFLSLFTFLYALFFFLPLKDSAFRPILENSGLSVGLQNKVHDRIVSVSRATIKGTLLIGVIQGALGGFGFWMAGIEGPAFWAVVMAIAAAIPGLGATVVVFGGAAYLALQGEIPAAIGLALWAGLVVGTIDNVLRPSLVGRDAQMSDLMIFVSTLGGLAVFGASGLVFGPVIAGVFVTIWKEIPSSLRQPAESADDVSASSHVAKEVSPGEPQSLSEKTARAKGLKYTASKADLEIEVEALRRELGLDNT